MKRFSVILTVVLSLLICYPVVLAEDVSQLSNLVSNSGFEEGDGGNVYGWTSGSWDGSGKFNWVDNQKHTGKRSACIENGTPTDSRYKQQISVKGNTVYRLSCWVKTENVGTQNMGANLSVEGLLVSAQDIRGTSGDWKKVELVGRKLQKIKKISLLLSGSADMEVLTTELHGLTTSWLRN